MPNPHMPTRTGGFSSLGRKRRDTVCEVYSELYRVAARGPRSSIQQRQQRQQLLQLRWERPLS